MVQPLEEKTRPAYVRFEKVPTEDRAASIQAGRTVMKDVDYVVITAVGTKDEVPRECSSWLPYIKQQVQEGRLPAAHYEHYVRSYEAWKKNEELPVDGTPLKVWPVITPAQLKNCLAANVRTVEDLAAINAEATQRIGMGAQELKLKAVTWLKASKDVGAVVQNNSALMTEVARLKAQLAAAEEKNAQLAAAYQRDTGKAYGAATVEKAKAEATV